MTASKRSTRRDFVDPDDAPDLSAPEWQAKVAAAPVKRGRPIAENPKRQVTLRLDADVLDGLRATGAGWQTRVNTAIREWLERQR
ncbi:BrnA antitoxin family protein [Chelatococcus reniformis]|uniref:BrnA antitoxin family protein n=1 Tax=Chelatococcus reniformis TaxID=1494448 RepID=A0A916UMQ9_9HYPH|nr:BrnA antitoxin family protein [Chelatococcus reniformis]GGC76559.1 hypothetical protein GCM10010994_38580 [Chelatococcus reniformis]